MNTYRDFPFPRSALSICGDISRFAIMGLGFKFCWLRSVAGAFLFTFFLITSTARASVEISAGYGVAQVDVGTPSRPFLDTHRTRQSVPFAHIQAAWIHDSGFGLVAEFADYGQVAERFPHDFSNGIPFVVPNNQFELEMRVAQLLGRFDWKPFDHNARQWLTVRPVVGVTATWADSRFSTGDGGEEGSGPGTRESTHGSIGISAGVDFVHYPKRNVAIAVSTRALWTGAKAISADSVQVLQVDFSVGYRF